MAKIKSSKPQKPRPDFPLFPHSRGYWAKKVRGQMHYFGKVADDPEGKAALDKWLDEKDALLAGRTPRATSDGLTIKDLCNRFLSNRQNKMQAGELSPVAFYDYYAVCAKIVKAFGAYSARGGSGRQRFRELPPDPRPEEITGDAGKRNPANPRRVSLCRTEPACARGNPLWGRVPKARPENHAAGAREEGAADI